MGCPILTQNYSHIVLQNESFFYGLSSQRPSFLGLTKLLNQGLETCHSTPRDSLPSQNQPEEMITELDDGKSLTGNPDQFDGN